MRQAPTLNHDQYIAKMISVIGSLVIGLGILIYGISKRETGLILLGIAAIVFDCGWLYMLLHKPLT